MELYGQIEDADGEPSTLSEVTISARPQELRRLSEFLLKCADEIESSGEWEHEHYSDFAGETLNRDLIVARP